MLTAKNHAKWQYWIDEPEFLMAQRAVIKQIWYYREKVEYISSVNKICLEHGGL